MPSQFKTGAYQFKIAELVGGWGHDTPAIGVATISLIGGKGVNDLPNQQLTASLFFTSIHSPVIALSCPLGHDSLPQPPAFSAARYKKETS